MSLVLAGVFPGLATLPSHVPDLTINTVHKPDNGISIEAGAMKRVPCGCRKLRGSGSSRRCPGCARRLNQHRLRRRVG